jgi:CheY-like chemotaxis protein
MDDPPGNRAGVKVDFQKMLLVLGQGPSCGETEPEIYMRILIVEDEFLIAINLEGMLADLGHEVVGPARTKTEALEAADDAAVALVDVRLADGITGPEIAEALRARDITVVFTTANPEAVLDSSAGVAVISKPYDEHVIGQAVAYAQAVREGREMPVPPRLTRIPVAM